MVTKASTQCWDNSTKGLDASTALEYVQSLRSLTNTASVSTLVALYQASENLFNLFDKVILIEDGKCAFFGRSEEAKAYFEGLGFECPPRWTTPDFLTSVSDPHARRVKAGWEDRIPRSAEEFQAAYRKSNICQAAVADLEDFEKEHEAQEHEREAARSKNVKKNYTVSFYKQVMILTQRQFLIMFGDRQSLIGKWALIVFQALIIGSLFYNLPDTSLVYCPLIQVFFTLTDSFQCWSLHKRRCYVFHTSIQCPPCSGRAYGYIRESADHDEAQKLVCTVIRGIDKKANCI